MSTHAITNKILTTEASNERQNQTTPLHSWHFNQLESLALSEAASIPLVFHGRSMLAPFTDTMTVLTPSPDCLSTGAPRLVPAWWRCCGCDQLVNPSLASRCPICSHDECSSCGTENVP
ncbi:hypothetical protein N7475_007970 [Penicillium sp. IBT 31633x]|nr:hypothetical protein N7475_007970 [Penicillium sp. IBT 31633x]